MPEFESLMRDELGKVAPDQEYELPVALTNPDELQLVHCLAEDSCALQSMLWGWSASC